MAHSEVSAELVEVACGWTSWRTGPFNGSDQNESSNTAERTGWPLARRRMRLDGERITMNPEQCGGRPCNRGMRIRVTGGLELFVAGFSSGTKLQELPHFQ